MTLPSSAARAAAGAVSASAAAGLEPDRRDGKVRLRTCFAAAGTAVKQLLALQSEGAGVRASSEALSVPPRNIPIFPQSALEVGLLKCHPPALRIEPARLAP